MSIDISMIGSEKQVRWAESIKAQFAARFPGVPLPQNAYAQFWIDARDYPLDRLLEEATKISSPFTVTYPRYSRADVAPLLRNMGSFAVLDTETTGLTKEAEIVELAVVTISGEKLFHSLLLPHDLPAYLKSKARAMHSFSEEAIGAAPTLPEKWEEIAAIFSLYHPCAYNAAFDFPMIRRSAVAWGIAAPALSGTCTMKMFQAFMSSDDPYKLSEACAIMGVEQGIYGVAHTALADALATAALLRAMRDQC